MYEFDWDELNVDHIARHGVDPDEVEEVLTTLPIIRRVRDGRYLGLGRTEAGRLLAVIFERHGRAVRVVTAREMSTAERSYYRRQRR